MAKGNINITLKINNDFSKTLINCAIELKRLQIIRLQKEIKKLKKELVEKD